MGYQAVIFDLDGTLLDTLADLGDSMNAVLARHSLPAHTLDAYRHLVGYGVTELATRALPERARDPGTIGVILDAFRAEYGRRWNENTRPYPGIPAMLAVLKDRGVRMAVLSNKPDALTRQCVNEMLPRGMFDVVIGLHDDLPAKPDPAGVLRICERMDVAPHRTLFLGDSGVDMQTAVRAGLYPVGALWGFRDRDELRRCGAAALIAHPDELPGLLKSAVSP